LHQFLPARQLAQLHIENYERVQREGESLSMYLQAVRDAASVLRISESEAVVVARIVEGLTPVQRSRFVFQAPRSTFLQLEQLAVVDRNIAYADCTRTSCTAVCSRAVQPRYTTSASEYSQKRVNKTPVPGKQIVCFSCGKPGHVQKNYFQHSERRRKVVRSAMTQS
jgi:hypothetical protein